MEYNLEDFKAWLETKEGSISIVYKHDGSSFISKSVINMILDSLFERFKEDTKKENKARYVVHQNIKSWNVKDSISKAMNPDVAVFWEEKYTHDAETEARGYAEYLNNKD